MDVDDIHEVLIVIRHKETKQEVVHRTLSQIDENWESHSDFDFEEAYNFLNEVAGRDWHVRR